MKFKPKNGTYYNGQLIIYALIFGTNQSRQKGDVTMKLNLPFGFISKRMIYLFPEILKESYVAKR